MNRKLSSLFLVGLFVMAFQAVNAQTLTVTQWNTHNGVPGPPITGGGANIQAEYAGIPVACCPPENVRWLQRIVLRDGTGAIMKDGSIYPKRDFIDPQPTQPPGGWDALPWYDVTYDLKTDRSADTNRRNGAGPFMNDSPNGWGPFGPMSFNATTAVVCVSGKNATLLGAFQWGFSVAANGTVTGSPATPTGVTADQALADMFNTSLANGAFHSATDPWVVKKSTDDCRLTFSYAPVPEPATMMLCAAGLAAAARRRRKSS